MGEQLKNLKCIKQRIISGFFRTINNEFHGFRFQAVALCGCFLVVFYINYLQHIHFDEKVFMERNQWRKISGMLNRNHN